MRNGIVLIATVLIFNLSCDTIAIVDLPTKPEKLVINCLAQENEIWQAKITLSQGILGDLPFEPVLNASVSIYENDNLIETVVNTTDYEGRYFFINSFPTPGNTYRIEAAAPPCQPITASYVQPMPVKIDSLALTILGPSAESENSKDVLLRVYFTDPQGENYYGIENRFQSEETFPYNAQSIGLAFVNPAYWENGSNEYRVKTPTFTDDNFNGTSTFIDFKTLISEYLGDTPMEYYTVTLISLTKEYYHYLKAANQQAAIRNDPFAQPLTVKGNIENGFGIFAGSEQTEKTQKIND